MSEGCTEFYITEVEKSQGILSHCYTLPNTTARSYSLRKVSQ
jgi:hypothetical protein